MLVEHVVDATACFNTMMVVKYPDKFRHLRGRVELVFESFSGYSPVYGILTGLRNAPTDKVVFLPADAPLLRREVVKVLATQHPPAVVVVGGRLQPLFTVLSKFNLPEEERFVKSGKHRLSTLHRHLRSKPVCFEFFSVFDVGCVSFTNVNTKEDLLRVWRGCGGVH